MSTDTEKTCGADYYTEPTRKTFDLDYLFRKSVFCAKNVPKNRDRLCKYIEQIIRLSADSLSLDHLSYANEIIEFLAENFVSEPEYVYYLKRMLALCLMPPTVKSIMDCPSNISILVRFYDVMAKCIWLVHAHAELNILLFGVIQSSVLRRQRVPENSVSLFCCHEAIETSDLPATLMELVGRASSQTFLDDILKLSYNIAAVSDRSALRMMQSGGIETLVGVLDPNLFSVPANAYGQSTIREFAIMLVKRMLSLTEHEIGVSSEPPRITRRTLQIIFHNIKIETETNVLGAMKTRNDFCRLLGEIADKCTIDENEYSKEMITDVVMLCVWPETVHAAHWLNNVRFEFAANENFVLKCIMSHVVNKVFTPFSRKAEFQHLNTVLIREFVTLSDVEYAKNSYGDNFDAILNGLLLNLPYILPNSVDGLTKNDCCARLLALIKSLQSRECFSRTMVSAIVCVGIASNDNYDVLRKFKSLKADVLINSVVSDALKANNYRFQDVVLCGLNALNVFYRENQHNPEVQRMVFNTVMRTVKLYCAEDDGEKNVNRNVLLDLLHFMRHSIIRYVDQAELFIGAGGIERLLNVLNIVKYPIQLVVLTTLVDLAVHQSAKSRIKEWKSADTNQGYLEVLCEIWRREKVRFDFMDDEFVFRAQRDRTTTENLSSGCSPAVESAFLCAQPKIHALLTLVEFAGRGDSAVWDDTVRACGLARGLRDKATVAHAYHYYSLKLGEVWNENGLLALDPRHAPSPVQSQSVDIMTVRHAHLMAMLKTIRARGRADRPDGGSAEIDLENKLYEEIRQYHANVNRTKTIQ